MADRNQFKLRFMKPDEASRVRDLMIALQEYQKMRMVSRLPTAGDVCQELVHQTNSPEPINHNIFTVVAVDNQKIDDPQKSYIVGYVVYSQIFSISIGKLFYLTSFFIEEEYRGAGLGTKMIEFIRFHGLATGNNLLEIPVMNNNVQGKKFYSKLGAYGLDEENDICSNLIDY